MEAVQTGNSDILGMGQMSADVGLLIFELGELENLVHVRISFLTVFSAEI